MQGPIVRNLGTKYENQTLHSKELLAGLDILKNRSNSNITMLNTQIPNERPYRIECSHAKYESPITHHSSFEQGSSFRQRSEGRKRQ